MNEIISLIGTVLVWFLIIVGGGFAAFCAFIGLMFILNFRR